MNYRIVFCSMSLYRQLDQDLKRFPLPVCFDEMEERRAFHARSNRIKDLVDRYLAITEIRNRKVLTK
jgi:hypothetical protein